MEKKKQDENFKIDESQFEIDKSEYELEPKDDKNEPAKEETEAVPVDEKIETIHFPWFIAIVIGFLMLAIVGLIIAIKIIEG